MRRRTTSVVLTGRTNHAAGTPITAPSATPASRSRSNAVPLRPNYPLSSAMIEVIPAAQYA
jgi:hypothetical protein